MDIREKINLSGKTAIITGSSKGIGRAIALSFAAINGNVVIADVFPGDDVAREIREMGKKAIYVKVDITNQGQIKNLASTTLKEFGKIDILVNNAGIFSNRPILELEEDEWDRVLDVNLKGAFLCSKIIIGEMIKKKAGKIVNISSICGSTAATGAAINYDASKAGLNSITKKFALLGAPHGINVNSVSPHLIDTPMHEGHPERLERGAKVIPLGRWGKPEDIAWVVTFLVTDAASYITGQNIHVNGGMWMPN
jgi:3-oxoacyl-[acyl-carrier protein] reductase